MPMIYFTDKRYNLPKITGIEAYRRPLYDEKHGLMFNITWNEPKVKGKLKGYKIKWSYEGCLNMKTMKISGHVMAKVC